MSRSRARVQLAASVAAAGFAVAALVWSPPAAADPPGAVGWWTQRPGAQPLGDGALEVASSIRGEESVAAVRVDAPPGGQAPARLRLVLEGAPIGDPAFRACPAAAAWGPADGGDFAARPAADCATQVDAMPDGAGGWVIELAPLLDGSTSADLVLLPTPSELVPGIGGVGFTATFGSVDVVVGTAAPTTSTTASTATSAPPAGGGTAARPPAAPVVRPTPAPAGVPTTVAGVGNDGSGGSLASPTAPSATVPAPMFDLTSDHDDRPWGRLLVLVPLSAAFGFAAAAARNVARARAVVRLA